MTPSGQLLEEHDGLRAILDDVAHLVRKGHLSSAAKVFGELRHVVELHAAIEERRLEDLEARGRRARVARAARDRAEAS